MHRATVYRLVARFDVEGWAGLCDRRPVPRRQPRRTSLELEERILAARAASHHGPARLGAMLGLPASTVGKVLTRHGASRLPRPPRPEVIRYERARPGELLHVDTKAGRACPTEGAMQDRLLRIAAAQARLPKPADAGRHVGERRSA